MRTIESVYGKVFQAYTIQAVERLKVRVNWSRVSDWVISDKEKSYTLRERERDGFMEEDRDEKEPNPAAYLKVFDPESPPFEPQYLCIYLRELEDSSLIEEVHPDDQKVCQGRD